jgi:hypothetical protein
MQQKGIFMAENHKKNPSFFYKMRDFLQVFSIICM